MQKRWIILLHEAFDREFDEFAEPIQDELLAHALLLRQYGPDLGRPTVDTLKGSQYTNMKELRFSVSGQIWRVAFAFDPKRRAVLLVAGNKAGADQRRFYKRLIQTADKRFTDHLAVER